MGDGEGSQVIKEIEEALKKNVKVLRAAVKVLREMVEVYREAVSFCCALRSFKLKGLVDQTSSWHLKDLVEES